MLSNNLTFQISTVLLIILGFIFFVMSLLGFDANYLAFSISLFNFFFVVYLFNFKVFRNNVVIIFFCYQLLILVVPWIYISFSYEDSQIYNYMMVRGFDYSDLFFSNALILMAHFLVAIFYLFFTKVNLKLPFYKLFKINLFKGNKLFIIIVFLIISYSMKLYLVKVGAWFMYEQVDLTEYPLINIANFLEKLDVLILFYFSYLQKNNKLTITFKTLLLLILLLSLPFALISTSKEKVLLLFVPIFLMMMSLRSRVVPIVSVIVFVIFLRFFFDYINVVRYSDDFMAATDSFISGETDIQEKSIFDDSILMRLDYQAVLAVVTSYYPVYPESVRFDYINNVLAFIPRFLWPNKPVMNLDMNKMGRDIGLIHSNNYHTYIGITPFGVSYYQLGLLGLPFISAFIAFLLSFVRTNFLIVNWPGYLMSYMFAISIARNGTYITILPLLILTFVVCYFVTILLYCDNEPK